MRFIVLAALCSVCVSILLKFAKQNGYAPIQMITWNYAAASLLSWWWFQPDFTAVSVQTPWWLIVSLGILLPSVFLCLAQALHHAGILKTEIAQRLSVVLSLTAAYFIFNESFSGVKIFGIALGVLAIITLISSHRHGQVATSHGMWYLVLVWLGYALIDVLLKYTTSLGVQFALILNLMFIFAFVISLAWLRLRAHTWGEAKNIMAGLGLGVLNFANIALYIQAHRLLKDTPAVVFAGMNILVVVFGVLAGVWLFKEKLKARSVLGLILALMSVGCLAVAMSSI